MPALAGAREKARRIACVANLKQIGLGLGMYCDDCGGMVPPNAASGNHSGVGSIRIRGPTSSGILLAIGHVYP